MLFATILPTILWQDLKFLWINYRKIHESRIINALGSPLQDRRPILAKQYFFVLGVLIGQCNFLFRYNFPFPCVNCFLMSLNACLAGQRVSSMGFSPRILAAFWCLSAVVFASAYVGILMSFLSFPKLSPIVSRLEELPGSKLKWGVQRGTALESLFIVRRRYNLTFYS